MSLVFQADNQELTALQQAEKKEAEHLQEHATLRSSFNSLLSVAQASAKPN